MLVWFCRIGYGSFGGDRLMQVGGLVKLVVVVALAAIFGGAGAGVGGVGRGNGCRRGGGYGNSVGCAFVAYARTWRLVAFAPTTDRLVPGLGLGVLLDCRQPHRQADLHMAPTFAPHFVGPGPLCVFLSFFVRPFSRVGQCTKLWPFFPFVPQVWQPGASF